MPVPPLYLTRGAANEYRCGKVGRRYYGIIDLRAASTGAVHLGAGAEGDQPDGRFGRAFDRFKQWSDKKVRGFDHAPVRKGEYEGLTGVERGVPGHEQLMRKLGFLDRTEGLGFALTKGSGGPKDLFFESMLNQENLPGGATTRVRSAARASSISRSTQDAASPSSGSRATARCPMTGSRPCSQSSRNWPVFTS